MQTFLFLLLAPALLPALAAAAGPEWSITDYPRRWFLNEGTYQIGIESAYTRTDENFNNDFDRVTATDPYGNILDHVDRISGRLHGAFGFTPSFSVQGQVTGLYLNNVLVSPATFPDKQRYGGGDGFLAARYAFINHPNFLMGIEAAWTFPTYGDANFPDPPLGDQSNDVTGMLRLAWLPNDVLSLAIGGGYTARSSNYAAEIPYFGRMDFRFPGNNQFRIFGEWKAFLSMRNDSLDPNLVRADIPAGGSYLTRAINAENGKLGGGFGFALNREFEISGGYYRSMVGRNSAVENTFILGGSYRVPQRSEYSVPSEEVEKKSLDPVVRKLSRPMPKVERLGDYKYGFTAKVDRLSQLGNYVRIDAGSMDGVAVGDPFHFFHDGTLVADGRVVAVRPDNAFLRVEQRYTSSLTIVEGGDARRVISEE